MFTFWENSWKTEMTHNIKYERIMSIGNSFAKIVAN